MSSHHCILWSPVEVALDNIYFISEFVLVLATLLQCGNQCTCHYNQTNNANVFTCTGPRTTRLPNSVPRYTNWIEITDTSVRELCGSYPYLQPDAINVTRVNLAGSKVSRICDDTLDSILLTSHLKWLSLAENNLSQISEKFTSRSDHLEGLWLSGNPIHCGCDMIWMIDWLPNAKGASGSLLVRDYRNVTCGPGLKAGTPVWLLDKVQLGCFPKHLPGSTVLILSIFGGFIFLGLVVIILVYKNRVLVRWLVYKHFGALTATHFYPLC